MPKINFIISSVPWDITCQRILQFDWLTAFRPITREPEFCQIRDWWRNINNNINFYLDYFQEKILKIFFKIPKKLFWAILGNFCPNLGKNEFSWKKGLSVWHIDSQTERQTEDSGPTVGQRSNKSNLDRVWLCFRGKNNRKPNTFIKAMVHRSNIHYSKMNQKGNWKKHIQFPLELQKNEISQALSSALHLEVWARYFRHRYSILKDNWFKGDKISPMLSGKILCCIDWT